MLDYMNVLEKAAITGVFTGLASTITTGSYFNVPFFGMSCPLYVFTAVAGAVSSVANDGIHYLIKKEIPINKKAQDEASLYLGAIIGAGAYYGVVSIFNQYLTRDIGTYTLLLTGAAAEVAGSLTYNMIKG